VRQHSIFLRTGCLLPDELDLVQEKFGETWMSVGDTLSVALDVRVRKTGWHFMWLEDAYSRHGFGRTAESAISKAITLALNEVKVRFNAAELGSVNSKGLADDISRRPPDSIRQYLSPGSRSSISRSRIFACNVTTPGYLVPKLHTSAEGTSTTSYSPADRPSGRTETLFISITEQVTHA